MCSQTVLVLILCGLLFVNNLPARNASIIDNLKNLINETVSRSKEVENENIRLGRIIDNNDVKFEKDINDLKAESANVSQALRSETHKYIEQYVKLTALRTQESKLKKRLETLKRWAEAQKLVITFYEQKLDIYTDRMENGTAKKCMDFAINNRKALREKWLLDDEVFVVARMLQHRKTRLKKKTVINEKLRNKLNASNAYYELQLNNLKDIMEANKNDAEKAKRTTEEFVTETKALEGRISELKKERDKLTKEKIRIEGKLSSLQESFFDIIREIKCYKTLEREVLKQESSIGGTQRPFWLLTSVF